jgi:hypothetical protein
MINGYNITFYMPYGEIIILSIKNHIMCIKTKGNVQYFTLLTVLTQRWISYICMQCMK